MGCTRPTDCFVVEAGSIESVRSFTLDARLYQWNTVKVNATFTPEEALKSLGGVTR